MRACMISEIGTLVACLKSVLISQVSMLWDNLSTTILCKKESFSKSSGLG
jgi:hypothetical protein